MVHVCESSHKLMMENFGEQQYIYIELLMV